jgi:hypothetical protein
VPHRDLLVMPEHCILVQGRLIPARMLVKGRSILIDRDVVSYQYFHAELETHGILLAEGLTAESYLDTGNRAIFTGDDLPVTRPADSHHGGATCDRPGHGRAGVERTEPARRSTRASCHERSARPDRRSGSPVAAR